jgi:Domain of unknown function (DUF1906)
MDRVNRRQFTLGLSSLGLSSLGLASLTPAHASAPDGRIAIIDTTFNAAKEPWLSLLNERGVTTVIRYYARHPSLPNKCNLSDTKCMAFNHVDGKPESHHICLKGMSIISLFQYQSNKPEKFLNYKTEAPADAEATWRQATEICKQPRGTVIYFGVDLEMNDGNKQLINAVIEYFKIIKNSNVGKNYELGLYGNGYTSRILMTEQKLVKYTWISASRGHSETPKTISCGNWHLFQNNLDRHWTLSKNQCKGGFSLDTNVQNPAHLYVGAWNMDGPVIADAARTQAIFDQRRFARCDAPVYRAPDVKAGLIDRQQCSVDYKLIADQYVGASYNVRVLKEEGEWLLVDIDEDGNADGYVRKAQFTEDFRTMPALKRGQCTVAESHAPMAVCRPA